MNNREVLFCSQRMGLRECSGQMAVELAILMPIIIVVASVVLNLLHFAELCARFDTVSIDSVLTHAVLPAGHEYLTGIDAARDELALAIDDSACDIEVRTEDAHHDGGGTTFGLGAKTTRFICTVSYHPWPSSVQIAGFVYQFPTPLRHERSIVVDCYRAGVVA